MLASSDNALRAAAPLLEPLLSLAGSSSLPWTSTSCKDGYTVSEIPSAAALNIPLKCFRTEYTVSTDITTFARLVADSDAAQQCDPTLKEIRILHSPGNGDSNTLLYTAYTSPSPWLISPRDFCVSTASVLTTREELCRVLPETLLSFLPSPTAATGINSGASTSSSHTSLVFLQNSRSTTDASCPPAKDGGRDYIRGFVHCYGYVAWAEPGVVGQLRVMNLCCVDACGRIPKWVVAAAVDQNTQKLRRMSQLIETTYQQQQQQQHREHTADVEVAAMERRTPALSAQLVDANTQPRQQEHEQQRTISPPPQQQEEGGRSEEDGDARNTADGTLSNDSLVGTMAALPTAPASHAHRQLPALSHGASTPPAAPVGVQTPGTMMSALTESPHATPPSSTSVASPPPSSPPKKEDASVPRVVLREASTPQLPPVAESPFAQVVQPLAQLAFASGWHMLREADNVAVAELRSLPPLLSALNGEALCVALRVSTTVRCSLDTVERILRCPARAPEIDPELVRLVTVPPATKLSTNTERGSVDSARGGSQQRQSTPNRCSGTAATPSCQLRHLQFSAESPFTHSWDVLLRCTDSELSPYEGGHLGFHTPGLPASTYVCFGTSTCAGGDASPLGSLNSSSRYGSSANGFERLGLRVFGIVAVAIPRSAADVRLTHYILFDPPPASSRFVRRTGSQFAVKKSKTVAADFLCSVSDWMCGRMQRVRSLCEAQEAQLAADAMAPLDKTPLLRYMCDVHRTVGTAGNVVCRVGDVVVRSAQLPRGEASASTYSALPPLFVFSLDFPCSLRHLSAYMSATAARTRYTMDDRVVLCEELPSSPEFSSLHVELRDEADPSFIPVSFSFLEAVGLLDAPQEKSPTLVLSRLNCDCPLPSEDDEATAGVWGTLFSRRGDGVREGVIYCSGWVASAVECATREETRADEAGRSRSTNGEQSGRPLQRLVERVKRSFGDTPPRGPAPNTCATAAGSIPGELAPEQHTITVTQYSCICMGAANDAALQSSVVAREALLLQRFRDAVCAWKS